MSYSFSVKASTKSQAVALVRDELAKVVANQPDHAHDRDQAQATAEAVIGLITDDDTKDVAVSVAGWLSWNGAGADKQFIGANVNVSATLVAR
jgi:hypothetical protein